MNKCIHAGVLLFASTLVLQSISGGHGGTYRGPGDTVPAGGSGGGHGSTPSTPSPSGPSGGTPSGPTTPNPNGPGGTSGGPGNRAAGTSTAGAPAADLTGWEFWWNFNKDQYLNLRRALYQAVETDVFFLNGGAQQASTLKPSRADIQGKIVPALKSALANERQNDIVTGALIALAKIGDTKNEAGRSEFEELMKPWLPDASQEIAETSALALGILSNDSVVATLKELAADSQAARKWAGTNQISFRTRSFATYGLGLIGARTASNALRREIVDALVELLNTPESATRDVKVAALISLGLTPVDYAAGDAFDAKAGASSSRQAQIAYVERFFQSESNHPLIRAHAPTALVRLISKERERSAEARAAKESIARLLLDALGEHSNERQEVKQSCVLALGPLGDLDNDALDQEIRATLVRVVQSGQVQERSFALIALGQLGGRPGLGEGNEKNLDELRGFLLGKLDKGNTGLRPWAALALGVMERELDELGSSTLARSGDAKEALRRALDECNSSDVLGAYAVALGIARDGEATKVLLSKLKGFDNGPKGYVALALGMIGAGGAKTELQGIVRASRYKPDLLRQAAIGLALLGDKSLVPELVDMLRDSKALASQSAVACALGFIGDARSIDPLLEMLQNKSLTASARGYAVVALGIVADKEEFPWYAKISTNINYRANTSTLTTPESTGLLDLF